MAWTQTQIDALKAAIASGTLTVEYDGKKIIYRSMAEMREVLKMMEREVSAGSRPRVSLAKFRRQ